MEIEVEITEAAIVPDAFQVKGCGALVEFRGVVRPLENDRSIAALIYEAYRPMAEREMEGILSGIGGCECVRVIHRIGTIPVGDTAILVQAAARHRGAAFALVTEFMDRLKVDVPIWKTGAVYE